MSLPNAQVVLLDLCYLRPIRRLVLWGLPWFRINPERKELVEFRTK